MPSWRHLSGVVLAVVALVLLQPRAAWAEPGVPVPPNQLITDTGEGAVSAADKDFANKVRLAGLWEMPAGQMAQEKSKDPRIKAIGKDIAAQHTVLDQMVRAVAKKLNLKLPNQPNADQQGWLGEMRDAEGAEFDQIFVDRLRAAHGKIFPAIATIRASTRNDSIRKLAQRTNQFVATHLTLLESSDLVDFAALPTAPPPAAATTAATTAAVLSANQTTAAASTSSLNTPLIVGVVVVSLAAAVLLTRRMWPNPRRRRRYY
jgi:predicted outer membrane protein